MGNIINVGFIGNPNCGKTTLFNAFTGANLKVANWPGVTVEKKEGKAMYKNQEFKLIDLPGIYSLTYKEKDRILRGAKKADGTYEYESHVDYWMPFNGGIGFHDATWRSKFGGTIFQTSGSHGCINLPPEKASVLYDLIYKGMPVLCYQ